jgi:hypothetical protein
MYYDRASYSSIDQPPDCVACGVGINCTLGGSKLSTLALLPGFWRTSNASLDLRRCPDAGSNCSITGQATCAFSTSGCRGGRGESATHYCSPGLTGPLCRLCSPANGSSELVYYSPATTSEVASCRRCGRLLNSTAVTSTILLAVLLGVLGLLVTLWRCCTTRRTRVQAKRILRKTRPETKFKILYGFYQILSKIDEVYEVRLPADVHELLYDIRFVVSFGLADSRSLIECSGFNGFLPRLLFWLFIPPILIVAILVGVKLHLVYVSGSWSLAPYPRCGSNTGQAARHADLVP